MQSIITKDNMQSRTIAGELQSTVPKMVSSKSAWGSVSQQKPAGSLNEVMSEQLADTIQQEQESLRVEQLLRDEALALSLQQQFDTLAGGKGNLGDSAVTAVSQSSAANATADIKEDNSDLALAQLLQQEFDSEYNRELQLSEDRMNRDQKIRISLSSHRRPDSDPPLRDEEQGEDWDEDEEEEDRDAAASAHSRSRRNRVPFGGTIITKHDAEVTGKRNAAKLAGFGLGFREGDTTGMNVRLDNRVYNALKRHADEAERRQARLHDKRERGTAESALDEKTRTILFKQVSAGRLASLGGVVATGKESVVLHAYCDENSKTPAGKQMPPEVAIKVFKTTLNEFKARSDYVTGDFRVAKDPLKWQNPRKVMRLWCEKELLNLRSIRKAGLPCPRPLMLRNHVLLMSFIGEAGCAAPRLKDCQLGLAELMDAWEQAVSHLTKLFTECRLVHADYSEYNLLWWQDTLWIIDVSQAVELGHPKALEFLLRDCQNLCAFFGRQLGKDGGDVDCPEDLFNRVTGLAIPGRGEQFAKRLADYVASRSDFEGDRVHLEHGLERREFQFDHFYREGETTDHTIGEQEVDAENDDDNEDVDEEEEEDENAWLDAASMPDPLQDRRQDRIGRKD